MRLGIKNKAYIKWACVVAISTITIVYFYSLRQDAAETVSNIIDENQDYSELLSDDGFDFGGGLIQFYDETGITQLSFEDDLSYDRKKGRLQISKRIMSSLISQTDYDDEKRYVFVYEGEPAEWQQESMLTDNIKSIILDAENCEITIHTESFSAFDITEDDNFFFIQPVNPREKYDKIVMIDPGHGGIDHGAIYEPAHEKEINIAVAQKLYDMFATGDSGIKAYMIRYGDETVYRTDRPVISNEVADMFVSIHSNSFTDASVNGTLTIYNPVAPTNLSRLNITNEQLASIIQEELVKALNSRDRGTMIDKNLVVLNRAEVPAVLAELGYLTNSNEKALLLSSDYQQSAAQALYNGILEAFDVGK